jgi:hypothetical protein
MTTTGTLRDPGDAWPMHPISVKNIPFTIKDLIGHPLRVAKIGDVVTDDYIPGRVTIWVSEQHVIDDVIIE